MIIEIDYPKLLEFLQNRKSIVVDVRENWEFEEFNIGGINIPLSEIRNNINEISDFEKIIVVCTNGTRSKIAAKDYLRQSPLAGKQICNLSNGILGIDY